ncbi:MAG: hypothetical protein JKY54_18810, partial [Flavobacteriales bacterium]|nr:hypothetical protein [Flavobacteriales bacterium]
SHIKNTWQKLKGKTEVGASYYASADDLRTLSKLVGDLGGYTAKAYIKTYGGKPHIILKGRPGLRRILTGTKYGIKNPKVITMGLGKAGAVNAAKSGGILSIVLLSAYRVADYFLTDQATLSQLFGSLATDIAKVGIAVGVSIAAATVVSTAFTVAIGPIAAVVVVGVLTSMLLSALDKRYGITDKVIACLDELGDDVNSYIQRVKDNIERSVANAASEALDYVIESATRTVINTAKHSLQRFLSPLPRVTK